jgi:hypothetical protein
MQFHEIVTRRITVYAGQFAEIPADPPRDLQTWICHAFFVPGAKPDDLRKKMKLQHIGLTQVEGGGWVYGGRHGLELRLRDIGLRR